MHVHVHVSGLLISLWEPANSLFVRDKYVTHTGKRLHAGYVQKRKHVKKTYHLIPQLAENNTFTFNSNFLWSKRNLYIIFRYLRC